MMRFFTKQWHTGQLDDAVFEAVPLAYHSHIESLGLPPDVLALSMADLHDGLLLSFEHVPTSGLIAMRLRCGDQPHGYFDLNIEYVAATIDHASLAVLSHALKTPKDEFLYAEVDRVSDRFEHRVILASHLELCIRFERVVIRTTPVPNRQAE